MIPKKLESLMGSSRSLRRKLLESGNYMLLASIFAAVADGVKTAIFARTLEIHDYGLMALAVMVVGILESFTNLGINLMVQQDGDDYLDRLPTYWVIRAVRGCILAAVAWVAAPEVASYYGQPELVWLVRILAMSLVLKGVAGFGVEISQRHMRFGRVALAEGLSGLAALCFGLVFLWWLGDVWALVAYTLLRSALFLASSYLLYPWWPRFGFDKQIARSVCSFGGAITVVFVANYFTSSFDRAVLGNSSAWKWSAIMQWPISCPTCRSPTWPISLPQSICPPSSR